MSWFFHSCCPHGSKGMITGDILYINYVFIYIHIIDIYIHNYMHINNYHTVYIYPTGRKCAKNFPCLMPSQVLTSQINHLCQWDGPADGVPGGNINTKWIFRIHFENHAATSASCGTQGPASQMSNHFKSRRVQELLMVNCNHDLGYNPHWYMQAYKHASMLTSIHR